MRRFVLVLTLLAASLALAPAPAAAQTPMVTEIGTLGGSEAGVLDVNASGVAVGYSSLPGDAAYHAFIRQKFGLDRSLAEQLLAGAALGFAMRLVFVAVDMAGELAGLQMGLGFASFFDPQNAASTPLVAQFLNLFATLVFLALDGHLLLLSALADSFRALPVGVAAPAGGLLRALIEWSAVIFRGGLSLALPVIAALLITDINTQNSLLVVKGDAGLIRRIDRAIECRNVGTAEEARS